MADVSEEVLANLPPSAKLVYFVLRQNGPMTQKGLADESLLPPRTVRYAIKRLEEIDVITERIHIKDARQTIYETPVADGDSDTVKRGTTGADD